MKFFTEKPLADLGRLASKSCNDSPARILVVEDDADARREYAEVLTRSGYRVDTAEDGAAAWTMLEAVSCDPDAYDLLITDNRMPKMSGLELVTKLREERMILSVILASGATPINIGWLRLSAILPKPLSTDQLVETVREVLRKSHSGPEQTLPEQRNSPEQN